MVTRVSVATDNFNRAGPALGANWTSINNAAASDIVITASTHVEGGSFGNDAVAIWTGAGTFTDDQYASIVLSVGDTGTVNYGAGVVCRSSGQTDGARDYYFVVKSDTCQFGKCLNGTNTNFPGFPQALSLTAGDRLELECEGTTIRVMKNGTAVGGQFTVTDSSLTTGTPGILMRGDASAIINGDDAILGNLTGIVSATSNPTTALGTAAVGSILVRPAPPPPFTQMIITG